MNHVISQMRSRPGTGYAYGTRGLRAVSSVYPIYILGSSSLVGGERPAEPTKLIGSGGALPLQAQYSTCTVPYRDLRTLACWYARVSYREVSQYSSYRYRTCMTSCVCIHIRPMISDQRFPNRFVISQLDNDLSMIGMMS